MIQISMEDGFAFKVLLTSSRIMDVRVGKRRLAWIDLLVVLSNCWMDDGM